MKKLILIFYLLSFVVLNLTAQQKKIAVSQQIWFGYFNQTRFSTKWGMWFDAHLRTQENFFTNLSQSVVRVGATYYLTNDARLTVGYAFFSNYPASGHKYITQAEHRPWQQLQWSNKYNRFQLINRIRVEQRYRRKILNDSTLAAGYNFNFRARYSLSFQWPINKKNTGQGFSFVANDEVMINFGEQITNNYFDQNRFFAGFNYQFNKGNNIQIGYMHLFQQQAAAATFRSIAIARIYYLHNIDLRNNN
jgi:Protein of unknown function (DUF2490)